MARTRPSALQRPRHICARERRLSEAANLGHATVPAAALRRTTLRLGDGPPIPLVGAGLLIGRAEDCELVLRDPQVSRLHARLLPLGADAVTVEDLGSSNGTFVNDTRVAGPMRIGAGDRLRLGSTVIMVIGSKRKAGATR